MPEQPSETALPLSDEHEAEIFNAGWDDDPDWKAVCECGWECWNRPTRKDAEHDHAVHSYSSRRGM